MAHIEINDNTQQGDIVSDSEGRRHTLFLFYTGAERNYYLITLSFEPYCDQALTRFNVFHHSPTEQPGVYQFIGHDDASKYLRITDVIEGSKKSGFLPEHDGNDYDEDKECQGHPTTSGPIGNVIFCDGTCRS